MLWSTSVSHFSRHPCRYKSSRPRRCLRFNPPSSPVPNGCEHPSLHIGSNRKMRLPSQSIYKRGSGFNYTTVKAKEQNVGWEKLNRSSFLPLCQFQPMKSSTYSSSTRIRRDPGLHFPNSLRTSLIHPSTSFHSYMNLHLLLSDQLPSYPPAIPLSRPTSTM